MDDYDLFSRLGVALAIGLLFGLERGWRTRDIQDGRRAAGFRTFALTGLLGGVTGVMSQSTGANLVAAVFVVFSAALIVFHWMETRADNDLSMTTVVAGMLTFLLGCLATLGNIPTAVACSVAATGLLALREPLHRWVASLTWPEIRSVLILLAMSFLLLPLLPDRSVDPLGVLNPHDIWLLAILVATVSFVGYAAMRLLGDKAGIVVTALAGGLASSTVTTLALARSVHDRKTSPRLVTGGILLASVVMVARVCAVATVLKPAVSSYLIPPMGLGGTVLAACAAAALRGDEVAERPPLEVTNPLALGAALRMAALLALVLLASELLRLSFGATGIILIAAVSGVADVDAAVITMTRLSQTVPVHVAAYGILVAVAVNTVAKSVLAAWAGGAEVGRFVAISSGAALAAAALAAFLRM